MAVDFTQRFSEEHYPLAYEHADSIAIGTHYTSYVSLANYYRAVAVIDVGDMAATATVDFSVVQASDSSGTGVKAITDKAATQLTQAGGDGGEIICIEVRGEELDVANGFEHVAIKAVVAAAAVEYSAILYGCVPAYAPVPTTNWSEIVD